MPDIPIAHRLTDDLWRAECDITHQEFEATAIMHTTTSAGLPIVWLSCKLCDIYRRTGDAYDPTEPQKHAYFEEG